MQNAKNRFFKPLILLLTLTFGLSGLSRAQLMIYPQRVVFEGNTRSMTVKLINGGSEEETYRITVENRDMLEGGNIVVSEEKGIQNNYADALLVYSPRQVTLQPNESQTVRISVRKPAGLSEGEYRSHLQFLGLPKETQSSDIENVASPEGNTVSVNVETMLGISIPAIVRHGATSASVELNDLQFTMGDNGETPQLSFVAARIGNQSVHGDFEVLFHPDKGKSVTVGTLKGGAVYYPTASRNMRLSLSMPEGLELSGGRFELRYSEPESRGGAVLASAELTQ